MLFGFFIFQTKHYFVHMSSQSVWALLRPIHWPLFVQKEANVLV